MSAPLEKALAQKKEALEAAADALERGAEALAGTVGQLFPLCQAAAPVLRLVLDNVHSKEVFYVKERFQTLRGNLDLLCVQLEDVDREIQKAAADARYFAAEENVRNQFRKYLDVVEAEPRFRQVKTRLFLEHFQHSGGEKNLLALYHGILGQSGFGESLLDLVERYVCRSRRRLEDFCARMKELLCLGLIALLGHAALALGPQEEEDQMREWSRKMDQIELRMKDAVCSCADAFPEQARVDVGLLLREEPKPEPEPASAPASPPASPPAPAPQLLDSAQRILAFLVHKYDWVSWSVRLVNHAGGGAYRNWRAGQRFHQMSGRNCFEVPPPDGHVGAAVSYSALPRPVPKDAVARALEEAGRRGHAPAVAEVLEKRLSGFVVHAVGSHKEAAAAWSFPEDCHYWERHKNVALCVHSE
ncbi:uncharacterized protein LOC144073250 [Stigmatopora argus]